MGFIKKTWLPRIVPYPGRRRLITVESGIYDVIRAEGTPTQVGDGFSDLNMNDLEERVELGFDEKIDKANIVHNLLTTNPEMVMGADVGPVIQGEIDDIKETLNVVNDTEAYNVSAAGVSGTTYTLIDFVAPSDGIYLLTGRVTFAANSSGHRNAGIYITNHEAISTQVPVNSGTYNTVIPLVTPRLSLKQGDTIQVNAVAAGNSANIAIQCVAKIKSSS